MNYLRFLAEHRMEFELNDVVTVDGISYTFSEDTLYVSGDDEWTEVFVLPNNLTLQETLEGLDQWFGRLLMLAEHSELDANWYEYIWNLYNSIISK